MKKKTVLIGLGTIARHHSLGLRESALFDLVAVCDQNPDAVSRLCYPDLPFYEDARQMLAEIEPEVAVIATSPASHSLLVSLCSEYGVFALVEKPLATNQEDSEKMLSMLRQNRFNMIYHWMFSQEILWFKRCIRVYGARRIHFRVEDPYADADGHIRPSRRFLGGCWIDSGVNVLSVLSLWANLDTVTPVRITHKKDGDIPVETHALLRAGNVDVEIDISWLTGRNYKETTIQIGDDEYVLQHSLQSVSMNGETIFSDNSIERLDRHYYNFYCLYPSSLISEKTTEAIHKLLIENI